MKKILLNFLILAAILMMVGCSKSKPPKEASNIPALEKTAKTNIRLENLKQVARGLGAQASLANRSYQLNAMLYSQRRKLDNIFNFNYLMLNQNVLPPILVEGRNILNLADNFTIRVSDHEYQIAEAPRFTTTPPNWRHYIWMRYKKPEQPNSTMQPQSELERKIWNKYIHIGWLEGVTQADQIFSANLSRLKRDYEGMILYRKLLAQNMVTPPYVAEADLGITGDGTNLNINDRILRITSISQLQTNPKNWRPVISTKKKPPRIPPNNITGKIK